MLNKSGTFLTLIGIFSQPGSPNSKSGFPNSPVRHEDSKMLLSPKDRSKNEIASNKFRSYITGASAIKSPNVDYSEINNSTGPESGMFSNSQILSPTSHSKPNQSIFRSPNIGIKSGDTNQKMPFSSSYVANVIERDLFRSTFINTKGDYTQNAQKKDENEDSLEPPVYRRRNL